MKYTDKILSTQRKSFTNLFNKNFKNEIIDSLEYEEKAIMIQATYIVTDLVEKQIIVNQVLDEEDVHFKVAVELQYVNMMARLSISTKNPEEFYLIMLNVLAEFENNLNELEYYELSANFNLFSIRLCSEFISQLNKIISI